MIIRVIIIDDEPLARKGINNLLAGFDNIQVICECEDGFSAIEQIELHKPDLIFLDIQMPEINGFEVVSALDKNSMPLVIFITAFDEYAVKAFQIHAVDYLLKPVKEELFQQAVERARQLIYQRQQTSYLKKTIALIKDINKATKYVQRFIVRKRGRILVIPLEKINWFGAEGDYVALHLNNEKHLMRDTLNRIEILLDPDQFVRINRSTILPISFIKEMKRITKGDYQIFLNNNTTHKLSRNYRENVFNKLKKKLL